LNVTEILSPSAKFGANGPDKDGPTTSKSDLEDEERGPYVVRARSTHADRGVHEDVLPITGKSNTVYSRHSGICIRPQLFPDAVTHVSTTRSREILRRADALDVRNFENTVF